MISIILKRKICVVVKFVVVKVLLVCGYVIKLWVFKDV